ncbi:anti-sigma-V factor rsiV [Paraclostridium sordellii]|uniref:anti-sigma-V factor rsiV n=1 Tax=Paraclostridium sordellii TaxID=1505 RepID=UPI0005E44806|nr:anti-sigma-V factor rsiV [Paeniclostridium sordellii]MBX9180362.1 anti-sigma-V factor rsiV [Paeniclostridium sordellii]CEN92793.1 anti-sigma(V) factor RsiV [[Clostridium] sordellii] [Paeniclostridium sordellii]CEN96337.1 anti-sigma(V) factor RsiV [[Clostridium] sordellii] [Paeniclostridium sordellii]CEO10149.1 anti-sigma(V) factor RsiV [[Clostridium] sordellii] [Paeniclostridium sordellii]CEO25826.1 anti-sigma(V) factor RsiV [[Clostridium] sordellii] [Paeniclostridium sordellii]
MGDRYKIDKLKENYNNIKIPARLNDVVNDAINKKSNHKIPTKWLVTAASICAVVGAININPVFADNLEQIPVIGNIVKIVNFSNYQIKDNGYEASIKVPKIEGLDNKELEYKLNKEFEENGKKLYNQYLEEVKGLKESNESGHKSAESWYEVKTDNDNILSLVIYEYEAEGSSNTTRRFYNIDKKNQTALTLEGMFKNDDYINVISENIKQQMAEQMKKDKNKIYWLNDKEARNGNFKSIKKDQGFYINKSGELVICFDKYEVGPGAMGLVEFTIPKDIIKPLMN